MDCASTNSACLYFVGSLVILFNCISKSHVAIFPTVISSFSHFIVQFSQGPKLRHISLWPWLLPPGVLMYFTWCVRENKKWRKEGIYLSVLQHQKREKFAQVTNPRQMMSTTLFLLNNWSVPWWWVDVRGRPLTLLNVKRLTPRAKLGD